jgi:hypothetical protein
MFRRRQAKTQGRLMREELGESFEHLRLAVGHATGGAANLVGPRFGSAKRSVKPGLRKANRATAATVVPLALAASSGVRKGLRGGARQAEQAATAARKGALKGKAKLMREEPRMRRWPMLLGGLLAAGAAVGAAGALIARRRANRDRWEEYGGARTTSGRTDALIESSKSTMDTGRDKVQSLADSAKERAADMMSPSTSTSRTSSSPEFGSREDLYGKAGTGSNNSRS